MSDLKRRVARVLRCPACGAIADCRRPDGSRYTNGYMHGARLTVAQRAVDEVERYRAEGSRPLGKGLVGLIGEVV